MFKKLLKKVKFNMTCCFKSKCSFNEEDRKNYYGRTTKKDSIKKDSITQL